MINCMHTYIPRTFCPTYGVKSHSATDWRCPYWPVQISNVHVNNKSMSRYYNISIPPPKKKLSMKKRMRRGRGNQTLTNVPVAPTPNND